MAYKINGTTVVDNSRNVCACCVTSCCITASSRMDAPSGTTANRPSSPATGSIYFDTDEGSLITYDGSAWNSVGGGGDPISPNYMAVPGDVTVIHEVTRCDSSPCALGNGSSFVFFGGDGSYDAIRLSHMQGASAINKFNADTIMGYRMYDATNNKEGTFMTQNKQMWKYRGTDTPNPRGVGSPVSENIEWGGLTSSNKTYGARPMYNIYNCFNSVRCFKHSCCTSQCCRGKLGPGFLSIDAETGLGVFKLRNVCACDGSGYTCVPSCHHLFASKGFHSWCNDDCQQIVRNGFHCCGFMASVVGQVLCNNRCGLCNTHIMVTSGYHPDYFLDCNCCFTPSTSPIKYHFYCMPLQWTLNTTAYYDCKNYKVWILGCVNVLQCQTLLNTYCICNASTCNNRSCWELCTVPDSVRFRTNGGTFLCHLSGNCFRQTHCAVIWADCLWAIQSQQAWKLTATDCTGGFCMWGMCETCNYPLYMHTLFVDNDENLRIIMSRACCHPQRCMWEVIIPCSAKDCLTCAGSNIKAARYFFGLLCCNPTCTCCSTYDQCVYVLNPYLKWSSQPFAGDMGAAGQHFDPASNSLVLNNIIYGQGPGPNCCNVCFNADSMVIPVYSCTCSGTTTTVCDIISDSCDRFCLVRCANCTMYQNCGSTSCLGCSITICSINASKCTCSGGTACCCTSWGTMHLCKKASCGIAICPGYCDAFPQQINGYYMYNQYAPNCMKGFIDGFGYKCLCSG